MILWPAPKDLPPRGEQWLVVLEDRVTGEQHREILRANSATSAAYLARVMWPGCASIHTSRIDS